ncbi:MAG: cell division protein ZapD [Candidatus Marithrix sp.]|nr:cell division protein ZapD [Candidatus Marithrix sp.]
MKKKTVYEQPFNEHIKHLLRLEHLFSGIMYHLKGPSGWDSQAVLIGLNQVLEFIVRFDLGDELSTDLNYYAQALKNWQVTPSVNNERIDNLLVQTTTLLKQLTKLDNETIHSLSKNYFLNMLRQRTAIIGGTAPCDSPVFYHWLQQNPKARQTILSEWLAPILPLYEATQLVLYLIRNSVSISKQMATSGFYQQVLNNDTTYQLIQVVMLPEHPCYPQINSGKQRFTIRFFEYPQVNQPPVQSQQDINFELRCCMMSIEY